MVGKIYNKQKRDSFRSLLVDFIDYDHELVLLASQIEWDNFAVFDNQTVRSSIPIRLVLGCLMLKWTYNLGNEALPEAWKMNPFMRYFCGITHIEHDFLCDPCDFIHFRKSIGEKGMEKIFIYLALTHVRKAREKQVLSDTIGQVTKSPPWNDLATHTKFAKNMIDSCNTLAKQIGVEQRQTYRRVSKQVVYDAIDPKQAKKASKIPKTIAGRLVRDFGNESSAQKLSLNQESLKLYRKIIELKRTDKNWIYRIHTPFTACITKGKTHKRYEFGNKIDLLKVSKTRIITAIRPFEVNPRDSNTIATLLDQTTQDESPLPQEVVYDRGGKRQKQMGKNVILVSDGQSLKCDFKYQQSPPKKKFGCRAVMEPVKGHLKIDFRMRQSYLYEALLPQINAFLAAAGWNLEKIMQQLKQASLSWLQVLVFIFKPTNYHVTCKENAI